MGMRADTEQQKRRNTPSRRVLERMLGCDGIRIGAYNLISHHHALRACDIIYFENRCELGTIKTPRQNSKEAAKKLGRGKRF
jgi:hypothetical protein